MYSLCEVIVGGRYGLTPKEKSIIDRCLKLTYHKYLQTFSKDDIPTLIDFYEQLKQQEDPEAIEIATALELYVKGNLSVFANKTNINIDNRLVCFDIKDLGKLKTMGMLIVLDQIWNRITLNRGKGKRTWIYIDEIYLLFANEYSALSYTNCTNGPENGEGFQQESPKTSRICLNQTLHERCFLTPCS